MRIATIILVSSFLSLSSALASARTPSGKNCGKAEKDLATEIKDRFDKGEVPRTEVLYGELNLLDAMLGCRTMKLVEYCKPARDTVRDYYKTAAEEVRVGQKSTKDLVDAQRAMRTIENTCATIPN